MPVKFTRKGYYEVWRDGVQIDRHINEREALETITEHHVTAGDGDYEIRPPLIMAKAYGVLAPEGDTESPTQPTNLTATVNHAHSVTLNWTESTDNIGVVSYQVYRDSVPVDEDVQAPPFEDTGLTASTQYTWEVAASDAAGNQSAFSDPVVATTDANSAPVWSLGNQTLTEGEAASFDLDSFTTDADGDTITYSLASGTLPSGMSLSGSRNETLSGTPDTVTTYNFTLRASDGTDVSDNALTFTIESSDVTAPAAPTGLTSTEKTANSITLDWSDNAESDLDHYTLFRSIDGGTSFGVRADNLTTSGHQDTGLSAETEYQYYVTATDTSENESSASSTLSVTTFAASQEASYGPVTFNDTEGNQTYDLSTAINQVLQAGEVVTGLSVHADSPGALPSGVTLDATNEQIDFTDASGGVQASREVWIEVETAAEEITTFTLVES